ncbi:MAG: Bacterial SH3 domain protein [candidate division BRC1 bacterium ADurb.BinA364]|nr:MAG: Bacterial SH3 domain protein [candidate division BRC1 bacterium ADurb.BinA364]
MISKRLFVAILASLASLASMNAYCADGKWVLVSNDICNLRSAANSSSALVEVLPKFSPLKILGEKSGEYYKAETKKGKTGWAHQSVIAASDFVSVSLPDTNLRQAAGKDSQVAFIVQKGWPLRVLDRQDEYLQVEDFEKDITWVHISRVALDPSCIVVKASSTGRTSADEQAPPVFDAEKGVVFKVVSVVSGGWVQVKHVDGNVGFVQASDVWGATVKNL